MQETLHATHLLKLLDKMYEYEMDPTKTVGATERTRDAGRTDGMKPVCPQQLRCAGGITKDLPDSDRGDFRCRRAVDLSCYMYHLAISAY